MRGQISFENELAALFRLPLLPSDRSEMTRSISLLFLASILVSLLLTFSATTTVSKTPPHQQQPLHRTQTSDPSSANNKAFANSTRKVEADPPTLSFLVAGYPKAGTTSLLYSFKRHNQTIVPSHEVCAVSSKRGFSKVQKELEEAFAASTATDVDGGVVVKAGVKCPQTISSPLGLQHLRDHAPELKLIIGLRHPVKLFQSYFNFRVTSMHDKGMDFEAPAAGSLIGAENNWKDVSTDTSRFELGLQQLGKVTLSKDQMKTLKSKRRTLAPIPFPVFLYTMEQIGDHDQERLAKFGEDMQSFLGLSEPIIFTHENKNHFVGEKKHPETIDICESRYDDLRRLLVSQGNATQKWIKEKFLKSPDVFVGGSKDHFNELLSTWAHDPCTRLPQ